MLCVRTYEINAFYLIGDFISCSEFVWFWMVDRLWQPDAFRLTFFIFLVRMCGQMGEMTPQS